MTGEVKYERRDNDGEVADQCWICESWIETNISVDLNALNVEYEVPEDINQQIKVYVHFDFDDFQPDLMADLHMNGRQDRIGKFQIYRLVPQTTVLFFFSINGRPFVNDMFQTVPVDYNIIKEVNRTFKTQ